MTTMRSRLFDTTIVHARREVARHTFRYSTTMAYLDLDEIARIANTSRVLRYGRSGSIRFDPADHLQGTDDDPRAVILQLLAEHGIDPGPDPRISVLTNLRVAGYDFNPIAVWWVHRSDGERCAVVAEVTSTFRERQMYVLGPEAAADPRAVDRFDYAVDKRLHVSPFFGMDYWYGFKIRDPGDDVAVSIEMNAPDKPPFHAVLSGTALPLTDRNIMRRLATGRLLPQRVTALIHWQALHLVARRVNVFRKPPFDPAVGTLSAEDSPSGVGDEHAIR